MKINVFWHFVLCSVVQVYRCFRGVYYSRYPDGLVWNFEPSRTTRRYFGLSNRFSTLSMVSYVGVATIGSTMIGVGF